MRNNRRFRFASHAQLVQLATDLMSSTKDTQRWLPRYDAALSSGDDMLMIRFCQELTRSTEDASASSEPVRMGAPGRLTNRRDTELVYAYAAGA